MGRLEEARAVITKFLENDPGYTIEKLRLSLAEKFRDPNDAELWIDDLRKAGLPE